MKAKLYQELSGLEKDLDKIKKERDDLSKDIEKAKADAVDDCR